MHFQNMNRKVLMRKNTQIAGHNFIFQDGAWRNINALSVIGNNDDGASQRNLFAERNVAGHGQMIQFQRVRNRIKSILEIAHFRKMIVACKKGNIIINLICLI